MDVDTPASKKRSAIDAEIKAEATPSKQQKLHVSSSTVVVFNTIHYPSAIVFTLDLEMQSAQLLEKTHLITFLDSLIVQAITNNEQPNIVQICDSLPPPFLKAQAQKMATVTSLYISSPTKAAEEYITRIGGDAAMSRCGYGFFRVG